MDMEGDLLIFKLILVFKIVSVLGFLATGAMIIGLSYKGFQKLFDKKSEKYRWIFVSFSVFIILTLMFTYLKLF